MKRAYQRPMLVEYGRVDQLTLGTTGPQLDINITLDPLNISVNDAPKTGVTIGTTSTGSADCYTVI